MKIKLILFSILLSTISIKAQTGIFKSPKIGVGFNYGGVDSKSLTELSLSSNLNKHFSVNFRYSSNFNSLYRIGGGVEYHPFRIGIVQPSIGIEYYHNREIFDGIEEPFKFRSSQIPIMIKLEVSPRFQFDIGIVATNAKFSSHSNSFFRGAFYYKF